MNIDVQIIREAAAVGANAAIQAMEKMNAAAKDAAESRRLRNTRVLLENYRELHEHAESAVFRADQVTDEDTEIAKLMSTWEVGVVRVEAIKLSAAQTATIVQHIDDMLECYRRRCERSPKPEDMRRYRVINALYIAAEPKTIEEIAEEENANERTIYRDVDIAINTLSVYFFGVLGLM